MVLFPAGRGAANARSVLTLSRVFYKGTTSTFRDLSNSFRLFDSGWLGENGVRRGNHCRSCGG